MSASIHLNDFPAKISRLSVDSRTLQPGDTFVAYPGDGADGRRFIPQAIAAGASGVLWERQDFAWNTDWNLPNLGATDLRAKAGFWADEVYEHPSRDMWVIGVTGTNGKTSCTHWLAHSLAASGKSTAMIGTLGSGFPNKLDHTGYTTPDAITLQTQLKDFRDQGAQAIAMEVSSHGLDQGRVNGVKFDVAMLTNLSRDHLDYHGDMQSYAKAKSSLFEREELQYAVLNLDDPFGQSLTAKLGCGGVKVAGYGFHHQPENCQIAVLGKNLEMSANGMRFEVATPWGKASIESAMLGRFNASNLLGTLSALLVSGVPLDSAIAGLAQAQPVAGRLQKLGGGTQPIVVVDYAHTPDALEKVLQALREITATDARLVCVFGCGGNRDKGKRPQMGRIASALADSVIVTSDNPRHENSRHIIEQITEDMEPNFHVEEDRAAAIDIAIRQARPGDIVLIAGKGHERHQEIAGIKYPFSDVEVAQRILQETRPC
ncbi:MAG: UDP-N-acetylmuramoyl-L-alanyl-D-glutamate--2,6-diaminopimelate ligase [Sulfuricellaceae bacterium]|nr:UDP-N-acetylmuramoyl-L-alanyl-D-glutamate--2,6-diaminopimelate ligase [Sulfuricellaceae bacterium]